MENGYEEISREEAKRLIDETDRGILVVMNAETIPCLGDIPPEERRAKLSSEGYKFGDLED
ncbi:hypothetical protein [Natrinema sp. DC36]|uniref:hypothetical protein n=1 Tax=Natrinema sp. DC36 TaxID=2878680 RepID=UPI001CF049AA|nr:hypothetical protein [Natrinema sp. DC36]